MSSLSSFALTIDAYGSFARLCAQTLVRDFLERIDRTAIAHTSIEGGVMDFLNAVRRLVMNCSTLYSLRPGGLQHQEPSPTIESRLLLDEVRRLQELLDHSPGNPLEFCFRVSNQEQGYSLVRSLLNIKILTRKTFDQPHADVSGHWAHVTSKGWGRLNWNSPRTSEERKGPGKVMETIFRISCLHVLRCSFNTCCLGVLRPP